MLEQSVRQELDKLHERVGDLKSRVVNLEAQGPHIDAALKRIEASVAKINSSIGRVAWAFVAALAVAVVQFVIKGGLSVPPPV